ncbi:MAG: prepilin peptidase [Nitrosomonadales bacterium]|nr:prepilin peptidase [Nitrosomonadales bacterium]
MSELFQLLQSSPLAFISLWTVLGLMVGSFLNVVIHRLPKMLEREWQLQCAELRDQVTGYGLQETGDSELVGNSPDTRHPAPDTYNLVVPRSACPHCGHKISALENIPVISYLLLRGKCKGCGAHISARYPIVEVASGLLSGYVAWHFGFGMAASAALLLVWALLALTFIDFDTQLLPDAITLPLLWLGLLFNLPATFVDLHSAVAGAVAGYLVLWAVYWLFKLTTGKEGMGYGDFKLLAAIGAWLGWQMLPLVILLSSLVGAVVGITLIVVARHGRNIPIPFGPYLAGGGLIALFWGQALTQSYLHLLAAP